MTNQKKTNLRTELAHSYLTSDDKRFIDRELALIHELEILKDKAHKIKGNEMNINIYNLFIKILAKKDWGLYFKGEPLQSLPTKDGHTMYKVNEVNIDALHEAIMEETEEERQKEKWESNKLFPESESSTEL